MSLTPWTRRWREVSCVVVSACKFEEKPYEGRGIISRYFELQPQKPTPLYPPATLFDLTPYYLLFLSFRCQTEIIISENKNDKGTNKVFIERLFSYYTSRSETCSINTNKKESKVLKMTN